MLVGSCLKSSMCSAHTRVLGTATTSITPACCNVSRGPLLAAGLTLCGPATAPLTGSACYNATAGQCCADSTKALVGESVNGAGCYAAPYCPITIEYAAGLTTQIMGALGAAVRSTAGWPCYERCTCVIELVMSSCAVRLLPKACTNKLLT